MATSLLRQFTHGRQKMYQTEYAKIVGIKSYKVLDSVIPDLTSNLSSATNTFVDGLLGLDQKFVESTSTKALQRMLIPEIRKLKASNTRMRLIDWEERYQEKDPEDEVEKEEQKKPETPKKPRNRFIISPYVIFGQTMEERLKLEKPWHNTAQFFTTNRYVAINSTQGFSFKKLMNDQIFGFNCFLYNQKGYEVTEGTSTKRYEPQQLHLNFETNSENHEFYVTDFNGFVKMTT